jgi:SRSO17 transposase
LTVPIEQTFDSLPGWNVQANTSSMPISFRLYLPEVWANDPERRKKAGVPEEITFETKPQIALEQIKRARERGVPQGVVLADAGYGNDSQFRAQLTEWEMPYVAGLMSTVKVWKPGEQPSPAPAWKGMGRPTRLLQRDPKHQPVTVKGLALSLPLDTFKTVRWRAGVKDDLESRFAAVRVNVERAPRFRLHPASVGVKAKSSA